MSSHNSITPVWGYKTDKLRNLLNISILSLAKSVSIHMFDSQSPSNNGKHFLFQACNGIQVTKWVNFWNDIISLSGENWFLPKCLFSCLNFQEWAHKLVRDHQNMSFWNVNFAWRSGRNFSLESNKQRHIIELNIKFTWTAVVHEADIGAYA